MNRISCFSAITAAFLIASSATAATLAHRYSFSGNTNDSVGGNTGILNNGATVTATSLSLAGGPGSGASVPNMSYSTVVGVGANYGASGITVESWYTDAGTSQWGKLFTFGSPVNGQEFALTNQHANGTAVDRNGANQFNFRAAIGVEHHLVITVASDGNLSTWLDGAQIFNNVATNPLSNVTSAVESIGATAWNDPGHLGEVNEFRIYHGELTAPEVAQNFALGPNQLIPEPAGTALLGLGMMLVLRRRRRG